MKGSIKFYSDFRGFGFIQGEDGQEYFVHISNVVSQKDRTLDVDDQVIFEPSTSKKGLQAIDVRKLNKGEDEAEEQYQIKKNPFTPQSPISDIAKFAGRRKFIYECVEKIINQQNILISGYRGIGKSSLATIIAKSTQENLKSLEKMQIISDTIHINNIIGDYRCSNSQKVTDIARGLIDSLMINLSVNEKITVESNFKLNLKIVEIGCTEKKCDITVQELMLAFYNDLITIKEKYGFLYTGFTLLIDEIDIIEDGENFATFLKNLTEKIRTDNRISVVFIIAGVTGVITNLLSQHQSANRSIETINLSKMLDSELSDIITLHLNGTKIVIDENAKHEIVKLANNFPHPVHLIAYHAYRLCTGNNITIEDVNKAKLHIVSNLRKQEFEGKFYSIKEPGCVAILRNIANSKYDTVDLFNIRRGLQQYKPHEIDRHLVRLCEESILERAYTDKYRFVEPLFKIFIKWIFNLR